MPPETLEIGAPADRHRFAFAGRYFWVDAPSGAVHELSPVAWEILTAAEQMAAPPSYQVPVAAVVQELAGRFSRPELAAALAELEAAAGAGLIFSRRPPVAATPELRPGPRGLTGLSLHIAHACNLRCAYCFAGGGTYHGPAAMMPAETARQAVDFLLANAHPSAALSLEFFGGEPLLNREVLAATAAYAREREKALGRPITLTISTNGTILDAEALAILERYRIDVVISLDGRPEVHNAVRTDARGRPTDEPIRAGIRALMASPEQPDRPRCYIRAVFTRQNLDFTADILHLLDLPADGVSLEPAVGSGGGWSLGEADVAAAEAEYERLALALAERWRNGGAGEFLPFQLPPAPPSPWESGRGCGAGVSELAVAPDGSLYPCHRFVGNPLFRAGSVWNGIQENDLLAEFARATAATKPRCQACWARAWCGGGCQANGYERNGSILEPDEAECRLRRKRLEVSFWLQAELQPSAAPTA